MTHCLKLRFALVLVPFVGTPNVGQTQQAVSGPRLVTPLRPLFVAMGKANVSGSLIFSGHCDASTPTDFPHFRAASSAGRSPVDVARDIFAGRPSTQVTQDPDGTVRMTESGVPKELLNVKISHISFEANGKPSQYTAFSGQSAIDNGVLRAPEVLAFMKAQGFETRSGGGITGGSGPLPEYLPHITRSMDNLTVSQALDDVLKTFPGIWVYEYCPRGAGKGPFVDFFFFDLLNPPLFDESQMDGH
jgi:hypothetical protein